MEGGDNAWVSRLGNLDWGLEINAAAARGEDVPAISESLLREQNNQQQQQQQQQQTAFSRYLDVGEFLGSQELGASASSSRLPDLPEQDLGFLREVQSLRSASKDLAQAFMEPLMGRQAPAVDLTQAIMGRQIAAEISENPSWDLRSCLSGSRAASEASSSKSSKLLGGGTWLELPSSSRLNLDMMETDEPGLQERLLDPLAASASGASRPADKLPKRTKLVAFTSKRRNREAEAFELHVKELRKEISAGSTFRIAAGSRVSPLPSMGDDYNGEPRMDLTDDLLHKVFSCLEDTSLCSAAMVCRQWRAASSHEDFWKVLNFEGRKVTANQVKELCQRYPKAVQLNVRCVLYIEENLLMDALRSLRYLQVLILGKGLYGDKFFTTLGDECKSLRDLSITEAVLGSGATQDIQIRHESLQKLHMVKCRVLRVAIRCPQLQDLSLRRTGTASTMLACPNLQILDVSSCHKLSDAGLRAAATACPLLSHLDISQCSYVSDETLREIALACSSLRSLDATCCPNISLEGVRMPMLVSITLRNCEGITSSSMTALSHCFVLEELYLDCCVLLTNVALDLPRLQSISLSQCRKFADLILRTPKLVSISVLNCPSLNRIDISSTSLQKLALNQQQGLAVIALQCPWLQEVDLTDCDSLTNCLCEVFSNGGGCPRLASLILDNCEGLTAVELATDNLRSLSLVACRKVSSLQLDCPNLERLQLDGCDHLTVASLAPVGLRGLNLGICPHLSMLTIRADQMTALDLRGCGDLQHAEIVCPALLYLDASYCSQLEDDCLAATTDACPLIESLILASCPSIGTTGLLALRSLRGLTLLDLSYTFLVDLAPIYDACPQLQVLKLSACKYLGNAALVPLYGGRSLPNLVELDLSYGSLGRTAIEALLAECPHLKQISLSGCSNVYDLDWPCGSQAHAEDYSEDLPMAEALDVSSQLAMTVEAGVLDTSMNGEDGSSAEQERALQTLNCVGCANIKRVTILSSAGCVHLSSLNLSLSNNIKVVRLACLNLVTLNLSHCVLLRELKLKCPRLSSLCLQASGIEEDELEQAVKGCGALETLDVRNCLKISSIALMRIRVTCSGIKRLYSTPLS